MIRIIAGGKKHASWLQEFASEYEKRLKKPFLVEWQFVDEARLEEKISRIPKEAFMILLDERGKNLHSEELTAILSRELVASHDIFIVIGGAFGHFPPSIPERANLIWSLSGLVLPHQLCRAITIEQIYRAQEIWSGGKYHHQ